METQKMKKNPEVSQKTFLLLRQVKLLVYQERVNATMADKNRRCVLTDEGTQTFLDLVQETNINAILDGKQK